jgi:hypothetical protein
MADQFALNAELIAAPIAVSEVTGEATAAAPERGRVAGRPK